MTPSGTHVKHHASIIMYDHPRWCSACGTQRGTVKGKFIEHDKPNDKPCPNSGQPVNGVASAGENRQTKIGA